MTATKAEPGGIKKEQLEHRIVVDMLTAGGAYTHIANMIDSYESFTRAAQKKNSLSAGSLLTCFKQAVPTPHITNMIDSRKLTRVAEEQLLTYDF